MKEASTEGDERLGMSHCFLTGASNAHQWLTLWVKRHPLCRYKCFCVTVAAEVTPSEPQTAIWGARGEGRGEEGRGSVERAGLRARRADASTDSPGACSYANSLHRSKSRTRPERCSVRRS